MQSPVALLHLSLGNGCFGWQSVSEQQELILSKWIEKSDRPSLHYKTRKAISDG